MRLNKKFQAQPQQNHHIKTMTNHLQTLTYYFNIKYNHLEKY